VIFKFFIVLNVTCIYIYIYITYSNSGNCLRGC